MNSHKIYNMSTNNFSSYIFSGFAFFVYVIELLLMILYKAKCKRKTCECTLYTIILNLLINNSHWNLKKKSALFDPERRELYGIIFYCSKDVVIQYRSSWENRANKVRLRWKVNIVLKVSVCNHVYMIFSVTSLFIISKHLWSCIFSLFNLQYHKANVRFWSKQKFYLACRRTIVCRHSSSALGILVNKKCFYTGN